MKDPDLLGKPNYTIHTSKKETQETKSFRRFKFWGTLVLSIAALTANILHGISFLAHYPGKNLSWTIFWIVLCCATPFLIGGLVVFMFNYFGEHIEMRYGEKSIPIELRLYDDCAVKYISEGDQEIYIQMPYDNIRRCNFIPGMNVVSFAGRFTKLSFQENDTQHLSPKYETVEYVSVPVTSEILSDIVDHSLIEIYKGA